MHIFCPSALLIRRFVYFFAGLFSGIYSLIYSFKFTFKYLKDILYAIHHPYSQLKGKLCLESLLLACLRQPIQKKVIHYSNTCFREQGFRSFPLVLNSHLFLCWTMCCRGCRTGKYQTWVIQLLEKRRELDCIGEEMLLAYLSGYNSVLNCDSGKANQSWLNYLRQDLLFFSQPKRAQFY